MTSVGQESLTLFRRGHWQLKTSVGRGTLTTSHTPDNFPGASLIPSLQPEVELGWGAATGTRGDPPPRGRGWAPQDKEGEGVGPFVFGRRPKEIECAPIPMGCWALNWGKGAVHRMQPPVFFRRTSFPGKDPSSRGLDPRSNARPCVGQAPSGRRR